MAPFSFPYWMCKRVFLRYLTSEPGWASGVTLPKLLEPLSLGTSPLECLMLRSGCTEPPATYQPAAQVFLPWHWFPSPFHARVPALVSLNFLCSPVCPSIFIYFFWGGGWRTAVCSLFSPLLWIQEEFIFSVCLTFYLLLGWCMQNWKVEVVN